MPTRDEHTESPRAVPRTLVALTCVAAAAFLLTFSLVHAPRRAADFAGYYTASKILLKGDSLAWMYDDAWFVRRLRTSGTGETSTVMYVNPPPVALLALPVAWLPAGAAKAAWNGAGLLILALCIASAASLSSVSLRRGSAPVLVALAACSHPFLRNLNWGQVYFIMLLLLILLWKGYREGNHWLAGVSLSMLFVLKYFGWMFFFLFLAERRWKEIRAAGIALAAESAAGLAVFGVETYRAHLERLAGALLGHDAAFTGLPNVVAFFGGLLTYDARWNPFPAADAAWLATLLTLLCCAAGLAVTIRPAVRSAGEERAFLGVCVLSVLFTPLAADHHYVLMSLPLLGLAGSAKGRARALVALAGVGVLAWYQPIPAATLHGWAKLAGFPRLYAAVLLWTLLVRPAHQGSGAQ